MSRLEGIVESMLKKMDLNYDDFSRFYSFYTARFDTYGNEIYEDLKTRLVHLKTFLDESNWFNHRFDLIFENFNRFDCIVDVGFSLPYLSLYCLERGIDIPRQLLIDTNRSAIDFSKQLLDYLNINDPIWFVQGDFQNRNNIGAIHHHLYDNTSYSVVPSVGNKPASNVLVSAIECVEHMESPENFFANSRAIGANELILSLPIGPKIPSHTLQFSSAQDARNFLLDNSLNILEERVYEPDVLSVGAINEYKSYCVRGKLK